MKIIFFIAAIILSGMAATNVSAQNNRTLRDEDRRIQQGVISGQLTDEETARLKIQEAHLRNAALRYKANDGHIGPFERRRLLRQERRLDRNICRQKHDGQRRF